MFKKIINDSKTTFRNLRPKTIPKQLLNNSKPTFKKSKKTGFFDPEFGQNGPHRGPNLDQNFDFRGLISTLWAKNAPIITAFKAKINP